MAALRLLPSGNWQASVLLDDGSRTSHTCATQKEAMAWATKIEEDRDKVRAQRRVASKKEQADIYVAALAKLAEEGQLDTQQKAKLLELLS